MLTRAQKLDVLHGQIKKCQKCGLCATRQNAVPGMGALDGKNRIMFVGEGPGAEEDQMGQPFVGASGDLLDKMIFHCFGLQRHDVFISNIVRCRPPNNRDPELSEISPCINYLTDEIIIVDPAVIVTLGRIASQILLGSTERIGKLRGKTYDLDGIPLVPTWHPSYMLRKPSARWDAVEDMKAVTQILRNT